MLGDGRFASVRELAEAERVRISYVSRILRLTLITPDFVDGIPAGSTDQRLMLERLEQLLPASWEEQRNNWC